MIKRLVSAGVACLPAVALMALPAAATNNTVVVTPTNTQGWSTADTRPGGTVAFVNDPTSPLPTGALQLTTDATTTAKAQYLHAANTPIADVSQLSYSTKQVSGPSFADPSYQLLVNLNGTSGFTTFVYEPYENGTVSPGAWQTWNVAASDAQLWSSRSFTDGTCSVTAGAGGAPFYSLSDIKSMCPDAVVIGFGVNVGSNNPNYVVNSDGVVFNDTTYDFEQFDVAKTKDQCKNGGYTQMTDSNGNAFRNQGDCVSFVATGGTNLASTH